MIKGSKLTKEHKKKISEANKGRILSEDHKRKIKLSRRRGIPLSEETKRKIGLASKKHWSNPECRKKHIEADNKLERRRKLSGVNHYNYGKHRSEETKRKISVSKKITDKMTKDERLIYMLPAIQASQRANPSSIEKTICKVLGEVGIKYKTQVPFNCGRFIADIFIPSKNLILECNGDYWHNYRIFPERSKRDESFEEYAKNKGYRLVWLWESEIRKNPKDLLRKENVIKESEFFGHNPEHQSLSVCLFKRKDSTY